MVCPTKSPSKLAGCLSIWLRFLRYPCEFSLERSCLITVSWHMPREAHKTDDPLIFVSRVLISDKIKWSHNSVHILDLTAVENRTEPTHLGGIAQCHALALTIYSVLPKYSTVLTLIHSHFNIVLFFFNFPSIQMYSDKIWGTEEQGGGQDVFQWR